MMMTNELPQPRAELLATSPAVHGALDYAELTKQTLTPDTVIDFSENSNPLGPSPEVRTALANTDPARYPDRECLALRRVLANYLGARPQEIVVGNGAAELLWLIAFAFLRPGDDVLVIGPTFGEYARSAQLMGAQVVTWQATAATHFAVEAAAVIEQLNRLRPKLVFLCNPNNPTGTVIPIVTIGRWATAQPQTLFVVDEAYLAFVPALTSVYSLALPNVLVVRSLTKEYALAGLRLGYALGPPPLIAGLTQARIPWSVNALAQAAGVAALNDQEYLQRSLTYLDSAKCDLVAGLIELGLPPLPSATHYMLVNVGDGAAFRQRLLGHGLIVRDCASFGLPAYVRIATRKPEENQKLLAYLR
jgi:histidinol-phosphate aminotransferase